MERGKPDGIVLQARDIALLRGLFESRLMTLAHLSSLYFSGKREMAKKRVQKLKAAGLIRERPRRATEPAVLFLGTRGFTHLHDLGALADYPRIGLDAFEKRARVSELTIRHELSVMDVKVALSSAIEYTIAEFVTWPRLYAFSAYRRSGEKIIVKPDSFLRIHEQADGLERDLAFFIEVDRSTETLDILVDRCHCYLDFYRSGGFAVRNGKTAEQFRAFPFRVLVSCKTHERRDNLARRLLDNTPPILTFVWLTTQKELLADPLGAIWVQPGQYRSTSNIDGSSNPLPDGELSRLLD